MRYACVVFLAGTLLACSERISEEEPDEGEAEAESEAEAEGERQHPDCVSPTLSELPELPQVNVDATGKPRFTEWEDLECEDVEGYVCPGSGVVCEDCMGDSEYAAGVCNYGDADIWCDGEGEVITWSDGRCWLCGPPEARAAACCAEMPGFDCRRWPYPSDGGPGTACARHEDCEPGLICGGSMGSGYGICQCPGLSSDSISPDNDCF